MQTNEKPQHTPGPWKISAGSTEGDGFTVCQSPEGKMIADLRDSWLSEVQANARLIAAAPEMLEALQVIYSMRGSTDAAYSERVSAFALAAIVKATGAA